MHPAPGVIERKMAESLWDSVRKWFNRNRDLRNEVDALKRDLAEERSGVLAFERLKAELWSRSEDDGMYWKKDRCGGPYCPLCLDSDHKLISLTHGNRDGAFYCRIHDHHFETEERRTRDRMATQNRAYAVRRQNRGPWS
jgi:hypothetical protein